jgi:signal peptidase
VIAPGITVDQVDHAGADCAASAGTSAGRSGRPARHVANLAVAAIASVLLLFIAAVVGGVVTRHHFEQVITGSMVPTIPVGSMVVTEQVPAGSLHAGDILVFPKPTNTSEVVVHRIAALSTGAGGSVVARTRGDANRAIDPWVISQSVHVMVQRAVYIVPALGTAVEVGRNVLVALVPALLLVALVAWSWRRFRAIARSEA